MKNKNRFASVGSVSRIIVLLAFLQAVIPGIPTAEALTQAAYRFRNDDGNESTATYSIAQDTPLANVPANTTERVRFSVQGANSEFYEKAKISLPYPTGGSYFSYSTVVDTTGPTHYAYTGEDYYDEFHPERVAKINLTNFTYVSDVNLYSSGFGEGGIGSVVMDPSAGYLYAVTQNDRFGGGRSTVYKISLLSFTVVGSAFLSAPAGAGSNAIVDGVIDTTHGTHYAYFIANGGIVHKMDLTAFNEVGTVDLSADGSFGSVGNGGTQLSAIDTTNGYAYFQTSNYNSASTIVKVDVNPDRTFARIGAVTLNGDEGSSPGGGAVIDEGNGFAYFVTSNCPSTCTSKLVKIDVNPANTFARIDATALAAVPGSHGGVIDPANGYAYFGSYDNINAGTAMKVDIDPARTFQQTDNFALSDNARVNVAIDTADGYAYFQSHNSVGHVPQIMKVSLTPHPDAQYRLEYGQKTTTCSAVTSWTQVPSTATGEAWSMSDSVNITDGSPTTHSAGMPTLSDIFVPGEIHDTTSQTNTITLNNPSYSTELEYSINATNNATPGTTYCFRLTDAGGALAPIYDYAEATIASTVPAQITDLSATPGNGQVSLSWSAPNDGGSAITGYNIEYGESGGPNVCDPATPPYTNCSSQNANAPSSTISGLTNGTSYIFAVYAVNTNGSGPASNTRTATPTAGGSAPCSFTKIAAGFIHTMAIDSDGNLWAWGGNNAGQLGYDTAPNNYSDTPTKVAGLSNVTAIAVGRNHSLAVSGGNVYAWGDNSNDQLGVDPTTTPNSSTPIQVPGLSNIVAVAAGQSHSMALGSNGEVWTWGWNANGQLGDGSLTESFTPIAVNNPDQAPDSIPFDNIIAIAAGNAHSLAVKNDGTVWAWGMNKDGELGNSNTVQETTPVHVKINADLSLQNITAVSAGTDFSLALAGDGTVWSWGSNLDGFGRYSGQLGYDTQTLGNSPPSSTYSFVAKQIPGLTAITKISAGRFTSETLDSSGNVWAWGGNDGGQLGIGSADTGTHLTPTQISGLSNITEIAAGRYHESAFDNSGGKTLWTWGSNTSGSGTTGVLGTGDTNDHFSPTQAQISFVCANGPAAITDLSATAGDGAATLSWTAPSDNGSPITDYQIIYGPTSSCVPPATFRSTSGCSILDTGSTSTNTTVTSLLNDTNYIFSVYAQNANGTSQKSNDANATPSASANCPGLGPDQTCAVTRIQGGSLSFTQIPANTAFTNVQNNTNLPSFTNGSGTDSQDVMSVSDLRNDPTVGYEAQLSASAFSTADNLNSIPLDYLYVVSTLPRTTGATEDTNHGIEYAAGCFGPTNDITSSVNADSAGGPPNLGALSTFTTSGSKLGTGNVTTPVVIMSAPNAARRCTASEAISYGLDLPSFATALGTDIPTGTYTVTFTYTLISANNPGPSNSDISMDALYSNTIPSITNLDGPVPFNGLDLSGNNAFLTEDLANPATTGDLVSADMTNIQAPNVLTPFSIPLNPTAIKVRNNIAYVLAQNALHIYDVTTPGSPTELSSFAVGTNPVALDLLDNGPNLYAYVANHDSVSLSVVNVTDPNNPSLAGSIGSPSPALTESLDDIVVAHHGGSSPGDYAYITHSDTSIDSPKSNLIIIDVTNPASPTFVAQIDTTANAATAKAKAVAISADTDTVYVMNTVSSSSGTNFATINVTDPKGTGPNAPALIGSLSFGSLAPVALNDLSLTVNGTYAFMGFDTDPRNSGFVVINVSTPASPSIQYFTPFSGTPDAAKLLGNDLVVGTNTDLHVMAPSILGQSYAYPNSPRRDMNYAFVLTNNGPDTAANVTIDDNNPANTTLHGMIANGVSCPTFPCNIGSVPAGQKVYGVVVRDINAGYPDPTLIYNLTASTTSNDTNSGNNSQSLTSTVQ